MCHGYSDLFLTADFRITVLMNKGYGAQCEGTTPIWSNSQLSANSTKEWLANLLPSTLKIGVNFINTCRGAAFATQTVAELVTLDSPEPDPDVCGYNIGKIFYNSSRTWMYRNFFEIITG